MNISDIIADQVDVPKIFEFTYSHLRNEFNILLSFKECYNLYNCVKMVEDLNGDVIEVGTYGGGSARLMSLFLKKNKLIYSFDTYEGLVDVDDKDLTQDTSLKNGDFLQVYENVKNKFSDVNNVILKKGYFPECQDFEDSKLFSLAHLDVDTYQSTLNCLDFLYPRMLKNGIIISHDFGNCSTPGVGLAFREFFRDKPEHIIPLWDTQCMIIKI